MPKTPGRLSKRVVNNLEHFQSNYVSMHAPGCKSKLRMIMNHSFTYLSLSLQVFVFVVLFIYCLITSPLLFIVIAASCTTCLILSAKQVHRFSNFYHLMWLSCLVAKTFVFSFQQNRKLMIANHEVTLVQQYAAVALFSIPIFLLAGAGTYYCCSLM